MYCKSLNNIYCTNEQNNNTNVGDVDDDNLDNKSIWDVNS